MRQKTFICSFSGCPASYDKEWKLEAHLCKHTGVVSYNNSIKCRGHFKH